MPQKSKTKLAISSEQLGIGAELFRLSVGNGVLNVPDGPENDCSSAHNRAVGRPALWPPKSWQHSIYFRFLVANLKTSALTLFGTVKTVPYRTFYTVLLSHQIVVERDALIPPWRTLNSLPKTLPLSTISPIPVENIQRFRFALCAPCTNMPKQICPICARRRICNFPITQNFKTCYDSHNKW